MTSEELIVFLDLQPLPKEGGYYRETYRSADRCSLSSLPDRFPGGKSVSTCIYYLLTADDFSAFHRLPSDELYHFYLGDPVELMLLHPDGTVTTTILGQEIAQGELLQVLVPAGVWQALSLQSGGQYALMGCTVAPGFDFSDYEHGDWEQLLRQYPAQHAVIMRLTRK